MTDRLEWFQEKYIFFAVLLINLLVICSVKFYPSMDGATHLYNSKILSHLIKGDCANLGNYFSINTVPIPNWTIHFLLTIFCCFLPGFIAEKLFLIIYICGLSLSFRYMVKKLFPENLSLSLIIFPFIYSFLFHLGFYNNSFSFIFFFLALGYWLHKKENNTLKNYITLSFLIILTYFSAALTFIFLGIFLGLHAIASNFSKAETIPSISKFIKELFLLFICSLPALIAFGIFVKKTIFFPTGDKIPGKELVKWMNDLRCLIVYYSNEEILTSQYLKIFVIIASISIFSSFNDSDKKKQLRKSIFFLAPCGLSLICLFIVPDGASAGMMSNRFCLLTYMLLLIWVVSLPIPKKVRSILALPIIAIHFMLLFKHQDPIKNLNNDAVKIQKAAEFIKPESLVLPINLSDNWLQVHFSDYLGADKPIVLLQNYEASVGWFPVLWNTEKMPRIKLGDKDKISGAIWKTNINSSIVRQIDFVFLYGNMSKMNSSEMTELKSTLSQYYKLTYSSQDKFIELYQHN